MTAEALGVDIYIPVPFASAGVLVNNFATPPTLLSAGRNGVAFSPSNTSVVANGTSAQSYSYTLQGAETTLQGAGVYTLIFQCLDTDADYPTLKVDLEIGQAWVENTNALSFTSGRVNAQVSGVDANAINAAALSADAITEIQSGLSTLTVGQIDTALATYDGPTNAELTARTLPSAEYATAAALSGVDDYVDTEVAAIKAVIDKINTTLELDGSEYRFTANALENAPHDPAETQAAVQAGLTAQGYTIARGGYLDTLNGLIAAIWTHGTRTLTDYQQTEIQAALDTIAGVVETLNTRLASDTLTIKLPTEGTPYIATVVKGDDYYAADGRHLEWIFEEAACPVLTGGTVVMRVRNTRTNTAVFSKSGTIPAARTVRFELTSTDTAVEKGSYNFEIEATLSNGHIVTLVHLEQGTFNVQS